LRQFFAIFALRLLPAKGKASTADDAKKFR
jgi:hypothetical protein